MTIWYVDPEGGNDSNNGQSFANRKRTMNSIASPQAGDQVRVIASRPRQQPMNVTWTDGSSSLTLANGAVTKVIDSCDTAWSITGGNPSVATAVQTVASRKEGTAAVQLSIPVGTFTGKIAYRNLAAPLDLSGYKGISFACVPPSSFPAGNALVVDLCSDTTGDVPIITIPLNYGSLSNAAFTAAINLGWTAVAYDTGAALPSNVQSIAVRIATSMTVTGTGTLLYFDNILATLGWDDPNHLSHLSVLSKDTTAEPEYYPVMAISGTTVTIGSTNDTVGTSRPYKGTSETVPTYFRLATRSWVGTDNRLNNGGAIGNRLVVSGGWDRATMSTQTDYTVLTGMGALGTAVDIGSWAGSGWNSVEVSGIGYANFAGTLIQVAQGTGDFKFAYEFVIGGYFTNLTYVGSTSANGLPYDLSVKRNFGYNNGSSALGSATTLWAIGFTMAQLKLYIRRIHGRSDGPGMVLPNGNRETMDVVIDRIDNNSGAALTTSSFFTYHQYLRGCTMQNNDGGDFANGTIQHTLYLDRCFFSTVPGINAFADDMWSGKVLVTAANGNAWDNREYSKYYTWISDQTTKHSPDGVAWKVSIRNSTIFTVDAPVKKSLVKIPCKANAPKTVSMWLQRDNVGLNMGLMTMTGYVTGVVDQQVAMSAGASTWQLVTLNFTPIEDGLVEVWGYAYGGTTFNGWFSDISVT